MSIKTKFVLVIAACMLLLGLGMALLVQQGSDRTLEITARQIVSAAAASLDQMQKADVQKLDAAIAAVEAHPALAQAFVARDRDRLYALAKPIFDELRQRDITVWHFHDPEPAKTNFLRMHKPSFHGDVMDRPTMNKAIATKGLGAGMELGQTTFALRAVRPWVIDGKLAGYVEMSEEIGNYLGRMKAQTGDDYGLLIEKQFLDAKSYASLRQGQRNDWDDHPAVVAVGATGDASLAGFDGQLSEVPVEGQILGSVERGGRIFLRGIVPVVDSGGRKAGGLVLVHDITAVRASVASARNRAIALSVLAAVVLAVVVVLLFQQLAVRRVERMLSTLEDYSARLAGGDYGAAAAMPPPGNDEIGKFERFFADFLKLMGQMLRELEARSKK